MRISLIIIFIICSLFKIAQAEELVLDPAKIAELLNNDKEPNNPQEQKTNQEMDSQNAEILTETQEIKEEITEEEKKDLDIIEEIKDLQQPTKTNIDETKQTINTRSRSAFVTERMYKMVEANKEEQKETEISSQFKLLISKNNNPITWQGSIMFSENAIREMEKAFTIQESLSENFIAADPLNPLSIEQSRQNIYSKNQLVPLFNLDSMIYINDSNWAIWVNGFKFSSEKTIYDGKQITLPTYLNDLTILSVKERLVTLRWYTRALNTISPDWKKHVVSKLDGSYEAIKHPITINSSAEFLTFSLKPRQSFDVKSFIVQDKVIKIDEYLENLIKENNQINSANNLSNPITN